jgi:hypothetical protein
MTDYDKWQTQPLVREGAPNWQDCNFQNIIMITYLLQTHQIHVNIKSKTNTLKIS